MFKRISDAQIGAMLSIAAVVVTVAILSLLAYGLRYVFDAYGMAVGLVTCGVFIAAILVWALWLDKRRPLPPQPTADQWLGLRPKQTDPTRSDGSD
jgi:hypothetical protein